MNINTITNPITNSNGSKSSTPTKTTTTTKTTTAATATPKSKKSKRNITPKIVISSELIDKSIKKTRTSINKNAEKALEAIKNLKAVVSSSILPNTVLENNNKSGDMNNITTLQNIAEITKESNNSKNSKTEGGYYEEVKKYFLFTKEDKKEKTPIEKEIENFIHYLKDENLKKGKMPEEIESHGELSRLEEEINLSGYGLKFGRGNWIIIDLGSKEKNEALKKILKELEVTSNKRLVLPSTSPIDFLKYFSNLQHVILKEDLEKKKSQSAKIKNQMNLIAYTCMAYIEILDEEGRYPTKDVDQEPTANNKKVNFQLSWLKSKILDQSYNNVTEQIELTSSIIESKLNINGKGDLSSQEAITLSSRIAEQLIEPLKKSKKRETLFKLRAELTSRVFEIVKLHRKKDLSQEDKILPEKPRYKTPCLWFIRHSKDLRPEVIPVETSTNIYYWGNPDSEKESHALMPIIKPKKWLINKQKLKHGIVKNQNWLVWVAVGVVSLLLALGISQKREYASANNTIEESIKIDTTQRIIKNQDQELPPASNEIESIDVKTERGDKDKRMKSSLEWN